MIIAVRDLPDRCNNKAADHMQQNRISSKTRLLALFGYPARHSLSPIIQNRFLEDSGIDAVYVTFEFPEKRFTGAFRGAGDLGMSGLNITMPYKEISYLHSDIRDDRAEATGSVNTVRFDENGGMVKASGFNTDIDGIIISLESAGCSPEGASCLVIGAGGAARSAVYALKEKNAGKISIFNRSRKNAEKIKHEMDDDGRMIILEDLEDRKIPDSVDLIINCTPLGMDTGSLGGLMPIPDSWDLSGKTVFETIYKPVETELIKKAKKEGADIVDGLDMLINQAASSFQRWFGIYPETGHIRKMLTDKITDERI